MAQIKTKFLENSAVTTAKIANDAVDQDKIRLDNDGYLNARNAADSADIDILKVNSSDRILFASVPQVTGTPSVSADVATVGYVQSVLEGLDPKEAVRVASTANIDLATALENGDTVDGVTLATGDRVLVKDQTDPIENGIYIVQATGAAVRSSDMNASAEFLGAYTLVRAGTVGTGQGYVCTVPDSFVLNTDPVTFVLFKASADFIAGDGIDITGTTISADLSASGGLEFQSTEIAINLEASNPSLQISSNELGLKIDASGGLQKGASGVSIKSDTATANTIGVTSTSNGAGVKFDANSFADSGSETLALAAGVAGAGLALTTGVLSVNVDDSTIEINTDTLRVKDAGITLAKLASDSVDENKIVSTTLSTTGALDGGSGTKISVRVDAATVKKNASNNLEALKHLEEENVLDATDITNQYVDLAHAVWGTSASVNSVSLYVVGGPMQRKAVDYTVSLTGGAGGVTRISFAGDLATGGNAALIATDVLVIAYDYLT